MTDLTPWLPAEALNPAHFERGVGTVVSDWSSHWFVKAKASCRTQLRSIAGGPRRARRRWRSLRRPYHRHRQVILRLRSLLAGLALGCLGTPGFAQRLGGGSASEVSVVRVVGALILCLFVAVLAILFLRHRQGKGFPPAFGKLIRTHPEIDVREVRRLTVQHSVGLIRHDDREYLLLLSPGDSLLLRERAVAPGVEEAPL